MNASDYIEILITSILSLGSGICIVVLAIEALKYLDDPLNQFILGVGAALGISGMAGIGYSSYVLLMLS